MIVIEIENWDSYKNTVLTLKKLLLQYEDKGSHYNIYAEERSTFVWNTKLQKGTYDANDFELNYKATSNLPLETTDQTGVIFRYNAPFSSSAGFRFRGHGVSGTGTKNTTSNTDYLVTEERYINGCNVICKNHVFGDYVKFQIVDVDNIIGYGANTVLDEFGSEWYLSEDKQDQGLVLLQYPAKIVAGLYIRVVYVSTGTTNDVMLRCNLFLHKKAV